MRRALLLALAASLALGGAVTSGAGVERVEEDDPRWDCRTMGNRTCGVLSNGTWWLVTHDESGAPVDVARRDAR